MKRKRNPISLVSSSAAICSCCCRKGHDQSVKPKVMSASRPTLLLLVVHATSCCQKRICNDCILIGLERNVWKDFWHHATDAVYIACPIQGCRKLWAYKDPDDLIRALRSLGITNFVNHDRYKQLSRAFRYRNIIIKHRPKFTSEEWKAAAELNEQLVELGVMIPLADDREHFAVSVDLPFAVLAWVDTHDGRTLNVPFFQVNLRMSSLPRTCICCEEEFPDIDISEAALQKAIDEGRVFGGGWASQLRIFPTRAILPECSARHDLEICRYCLENHISSRLDTLGVAHCETLTCPDSDCDHIYTHQQVRFLAWPATFERYDKMLLQNHLSADQDFRWCLREGCGAGLIYDTSGFARDVRFQCHACKFEMCFHHQTPWHFNQTCQRYDESKIVDAATQVWLTNHAKDCPGCNTALEKNGGCFHMTCAKCKTEFCWLCLAYWRDIWKRAPFGNQYLYDRKGHKKGCFFRYSRAQPTFINGNDLEDAILQDAMWEP